MPPIFISTPVFQAAKDGILALKNFKDSTTNRKGLP
jgi:hypothetical protein